MDVASSQACGD